MKKMILMAVGLFVGAASPALANMCPTLQHDIDVAFGNRADGTAAEVKALAAQAWALHEAGKHEESVMKYGEAFKAGGLQMKEMKK